jgi:outer membrane receptor protein involved in Fe transport
MNLFTKSYFSLGSLLIGYIFLALCSAVYAQQMATIQDTLDTLDTPIPWVVDTVPVLTDSAILALDSLKKETQTDSEVLQVGKEVTAGTQKADGKVRGIVLAQDDKNPVAKASVQYASDEKVYLAETDQAGLFTIGAVKPGLYTIKIYRKGYQPYAMDGVQIKESGEIRELLLQRRMLKGRLIKVRANDKAGSAQAMLSQRKQSGLVMEGVSAEQISKSTDSDAGAIARRVTGTSLVGGKYVFVRGLGERYTNMSLNGLPVPSPEKDKRVVPQDLFPAGALESFAIYKTFSAELLPDFAGGSVALVTKGIPDKNYFTVKAGVGASMQPSEANFWSFQEKRTRYQDGNPVQSYFGYDDGTRSIPNGVPEVISTLMPIEDRAKWGSQFNTHLVPDTTSVLPGQSFGLAMGRVYKIDETTRWGGLFDFSFSNKYGAKESIRNKAYTTNVKSLVPKPANPGADCDENPSQCYRATVRDTLDGVATPLLSIESGIRQGINSGEYSTRLSALANVGYESRNNILWLKSLYAHLSTDKFIHNYSQTIPGTNGTQNDDIEERFLLEYSARSLSVIQAGGGHFLGLGFLDSLSWASGWGYTKGEIPDSKKYLWANYTKAQVLERDTIILGESYRAGDTALVRDSIMRYEIRSPYGTRSWEDFYEYGVSGRVDLYLIIPPSLIREDTLFTQGTTWFKNFALPKWQTGLLLNYKKRDYDMVRYDWDGLPVERRYTATGNYDYLKELYHQDSIYNTIMELQRGFKTSPNDFDTYFANEASVAGYLKQDMGATLGKVPVDLHLGLRYEYFHMDFDAPYTGAEDKDTTISIKTREHQWYPATGIDFEFIPDTKTRLAFSRTVVRPEVRERAPTFFFDTEEEIEVIGNPELNNTRIFHYDLRFDWFLKYGQLASVSLFYKDFDEPIESVIDANLSPERRRYQNADKAYSRGIEFEIDLKLEKLFTMVPEWVVKGVGFYANAAFIQSKVDIDTTQKGASLLTSLNRSMMGQSPYLINLKLSHEKTVWTNWDMVNGFLFNVAGRRISALGIEGVPDMYEEAFPSLDFLHKISHGKHGFSFKATNLLDTPVRYTITDFHWATQYNTVSNTQRDELYKDLPRKIVLREDYPGISVSLGYDYSF